MKKVEKKEETVEKIEKMRHSLAHVLAAAVQEMYPEAKFGMGPAVENGFYYDIDFGATKIAESDLPKIEKRMKKIIARKFKMVKMAVKREEALKWAKENGQNFKKELIQDLAKDEEISFYLMTNVEEKDFRKACEAAEFVDLCKGPHLESLGEIGSFRLTKVAGAYWRADEKREMLTRIYGVAFSTEEELNNFITQQEEAKARDHRKLGKELDLFCFSDLVGSGLPLFTPRGTALREMLNAFAQSYREKNGYQKVCIPHIANVSLYKTSGHFEKFPELMRFVSSESGDELALKPVNCPHHSQIYASQPRSYKDLPMKLLETTMVYRDERKGELGGLSRVRAITQDDSHVFCTDAQVEQIFGELIASAKDLYKRVDMKLKLRLSFRDDGEGYIGDEKMWEKAQTSIEKMAKKFKMDYFVGIGEAAMYGPKMDFMAVDAMGREWQLATVQLDYAMPKRFGLEYTAEDGSKATPIMIHCALIGSIERFMSVFIEHTAGWFPFWSAPEQVRIVTVNDKVGEYVEKICKVLNGVVLDEPVRENHLRYSVDTTADSLGKKIKRGTGLKIPMMLIIGPQDAECNEVSVRRHEMGLSGKQVEEKVKLGDLAKYIRENAQR
ncbi:MAG: threonine--tRNA ligase [Candidatus Saccharibacteria bacterium]|nr:threonine--tRNA ligase [Candidatus Saccharibacteria bacterium]